jgi:hypothetical protein
MPHTLMPQIHACSLGVPAKINQLAARALAEAAQMELATVSVEALDRAIDACGFQHRRLPELLPADDVRVVRGTANPEASLTISMQGVAEREVRLSGSRMLIGRGEEADVRIDSVFVSRYHALIVRDGDQDLLLDLGSTNGLLVNSRRIVRRALRHRDLIQIGPARAIYTNELAMPAAQPDPGETICFARPGFPAAAGEEDSGAVLAFGRLDGSNNP